MRDTQPRSLDEDCPERSRRAKRNPGERGYKLIGCLAGCEAGKGVNPLPTIGLGPFDQPD